MTLIIDRSKRTDDLRVELDDVPIRRREWRGGREVTCRCHSLPFTSPIGALGVGLDRCRLDYALAVLLALAVWRVREEDIPRIGVLTAAFFVGSSIHIKLAVLPTSVHLILNGLVGVVLGRRAPLAIAVGLLLQYLLLAHGGYDHARAQCVHRRHSGGRRGVVLPAAAKTRAAPFARGLLLGVGAAAGAVGLNFLVLFFGGKEDWQTLAKLVLLAHIPW